MKIAAFELEDWERASFEKLGDEHQLALTEAKAGGPPDPRYADADIISIFVYSDLNADTLAQFKNLKYIATRSTGYNHIDMEYCGRNDIAVSTAPRYGQNTVAEHVFALLLSLGRHICEAVDRTTRGSFSQEGLQGFDLRGKTLGVIGTGDIGKRVIQIANGFEMKVLAFDMKPDDDIAEKMKFRYTGMDELLSQSDIITLHIPGSEKTRNLISRPQFERMKKGAILINTARGFIVDVRELLKALDEGKVAGAGLDVLPEEPSIREESELLRSVFSEQHKLSVLLANSVLANRPDVLITPHIAFNTREAVERLLDTTIRNIVSFIKGEPQNLVEMKK